MPRSKIAMVAIRGTHEGPWAYVNGMSCPLVDVRGLGPADEVWLEGEFRGGHSIVPLHAGHQQVMTENWIRYRACKRAGDNGQLPTTVEIFPDA